MKTLVAVLLVAACVDKGAGPQPKKIDPAYVAANLVQTVPPDVTHFDLPLGAGQIIYLGNRVDHEGVAPGQPVKVTHYWQVVMPPGPGWRVFALVRGAPGLPDFMNLPATDMELGHPVADWKPGEIIQDVQDIVIRPDWKSKSATLTVGLIRTGGHEADDRMAVPDGPHVKDRGIIARELEVDLSRAPPPPGTIYVPHAAGAIAIDGVANDPGWTSAITSPDFQPAEGCGEPPGKAFAKLTWDEDNLYLFVSVTDPSVVATYKQHDDPIWKQDAIELFIDADSNRHGYVELQVNPNNATFDAWWATTRAQPSDEKWDSNMVTAVKTHSGGWDAELAIPYAAVKGRDDAMNVHIPPVVGDRWRINIVRTDVKTEGAAAFSGGASSWNRITCQDFHALDRMLTAVFADKTGSIVPKPPEPAPPAAPPPAPSSPPPAAPVITPRVVVPVGSGSAKTP